MITQSDSFNKWKSGLDKIKDSTEGNTDATIKWAEALKKVSFEILKASNGGLLGRGATGTGTFGVEGLSGAGAGNNGFDNRMKQFAKENSFFIEQLRSDIQILEGEFNKFWENTFGEANSLLEKFLMNFASGLADLAAQSLFSSILNFLLPGAGTLAGQALSHRPQVINVNLGNETLARVVVKGNNEAQRLRLN